MGRAKGGKSVNLKSLREKVDLDPEYKREYERYILGLNALKKVSFELKFAITNSRAALGNSLEIYDCLKSMSPYDKEVQKSAKSMHERQLETNKLFDEKEATISSLIDGSEVSAIESAFKDSEFVMREAKMQQLSRNRKKGPSKATEAAEAAFKNVNSSLVTRLIAANDRLVPLLKKVLTQYYETEKEILSSFCLELNEPIDSPRPGTPTSPMSPPPEHSASSPSEDSPAEKGKNDLTADEMARMKELLGGNTSVLERVAASENSPLSRANRGNRVYSMPVSHVDSNGGAKEPAVRLNVNVEMSRNEVSFNKGDEDVVPLNKPVTTMFEIKNTGMMPAKWSIVAPKRNNFTLTFSPTKGVIKKPGKSQKVKATIVINNPPNLFFTVTCTVEGLNESKFFTIRARCESGVFGVHLDSLDFEEDNGHMVPKVLGTMRRAIYSDKGLTTEGIFRLAGDVLEMQKVKHELNMGIFEKTADVNCVANLLKIWFREMPKHILDFIPGDVLNTIKSIDDMLKAKKYLSENERHSFEWLVDILCDVQDSSEVNKMNIKNLTIVVAPNLYQSSSLNPVDIIMLTQKSVNFLYLAVQHRLEQRAGPPPQAELPAPAPPASPEVAPSPSPSPSSLPSEKIDIPSQSPPSGSLETPMLQTPQRLPTNPADQEQQIHTDSPPPPFMALSPPTTSHPPSSLATTAAAAAAPDLDAPSTTIGGNALTSAPPLDVPPSLDLPVPTTTTTTTPLSLQKEDEAVTGADPFDIPSPPDEEEQEPAEEEDEPEPEPELPTLASPSLPAFLPSTTLTTAEPPPDSPLPTPPLLSAPPALGIPSPSPVTYTDSAISMTPPVPVLQNPSLEMPPQVVSPPPPVMMPPPSPVPAAAEEEFEEGEEEGDFDTWTLGDEEEEEKELPEVEDGEEYDDDGMGSNEG